MGPAHQLVCVHRIDVVVDRVGEDLAEQQHLAKSPIPWARLERDAASEDEDDHHGGTEQENDTTSAHGHLEPNGDK